MSIIALSESIILTYLFLSKAILRYPFKLCIILCICKTRCNLLHFFTLASFDTFRFAPSSQVMFLGIDSIILFFLNITSLSIPQPNLHGFTWFPVLLNILVCYWMLKKQWCKWPLMELEAGGRFISDAFLLVYFSNLNSWKVAHFVLG